MIVPLAFMSILWRRSFFFCSFSRVLSSYSKGFGKARSEGLSFMIILLSVGNHYHRDLTKDLWLNSLEISTYIVVEGNLHFFGFRCIWIK